MQNENLIFEDAPYAIAEYELPNTKKSSHKGSRGF
jgi:hypothetical protein